MKASQIVWQDPIHAPRELRGLHLLRYFDGEDYRMEPGQRLEGVWCVYRVRLATRPGKSEGEGSLSIVDVSDSIAGYASDLHHAANFGSGEGMRPDLSLLDTRELFNELMRRSRAVCVGMLPKANGPTMPDARCWFGRDADHNMELLGLVSLLASDVTNAVCENMNGQDVTRGNDS